MQRLCQNWKEFRIEENHSSPESPFRGTVLLFSARTRKEQHPSYPPNLPQTPASVGPGTFSRLSHDTKNTDTASLKKFTPYPLSGFRAGGEGAEAEKLRKASTIFVFNYENESHWYIYNTICIHSGLIKKQLWVLILPDLAVWGWANVAVSIYPAQNVKNS